MDHDWLFRVMDPKFQSLAETAAEAFRSQLQAVDDGVRAGGGTHNETFSIFAHILANGIDHMVEEMRCHAAEIPGAKGRRLPIEAALGILLNDAMRRFWMARRG